MSRTIGNRLAWIEKEIGAGPVGIAYVDALRIMHDRFGAVLESADATPEDQADASNKLAALDAEVWTVGGTNSLNIIDALERGFPCRIVDPEAGDVPTPDWSAIAAGLGLHLDDRQGVQFVERIIVRPAKRDAQGCVIREESIECALKGRAA